MASDRERTASLRGAWTAGGGPGNEAISPWSGETASSAYGLLAVTVTLMVQGAPTDHGACQTIGLATTAGLLVMTEEVP